jgi:hypothetical protein
MYVQSYSVYDYLCVLIGDSPWFSEKLVDSSGTKKRGRPSSRESPERTSPPSSPPSSSSPMSSKDNKSSPTAAVPVHVPVAGSSSSSSSGGQSSSMGQGQSTETTSQGPEPTCPKGDVMKQAKGQRFTDKNGTIYPKKGDEIRVLYDEKDWYAGFVNDFDKEAQILKVAFEEGGETEIDTRDFPDEVRIDIYYMCTYIYVHTYIYIYIYIYTYIYIYICM